MTSVMLNFTISNPFLQVALAILLGGFVAFACDVAGGCTGNMKLTLALIPPLATAALGAVSGNMGASIAIMGVFGLVRFRSMPGNSRDILNVFYSLVAGVLAATGNIMCAVVIVLGIGILMMVFTRILFNSIDDYNLKILIPEDLNFEHVFDEILKRYFVEFSLENVKSMEMGTLFELTYRVRPKRRFILKDCMDELRTHNGNMNILFYKSKNNEYL